MIMNNTGIPAISFLKVGQQLSKDSANINIVVNKKKNMAYNGIELLLKLFDIVKEDK